MVYDGLEQALVSSPISVVGKRKLFSEDLRNLYTALNIIRITTSGKTGGLGHASHTGHARKANTLTGKSEGKWPPERPDS
jgi:hypothetical protein